MSLMDMDAKLFYTILVKKSNGTFKMLYTITKLPTGIYPWNARMAQHMQINVTHHINRMNPKKHSQLNGYRKQI
jgi:hypothetical protein